MFLQDGRVIWYVATRIISFISIFLLFLNDERFFITLFLIDFLFKFLVIGNANTGKSCLLHQFIENKCKVILLASYFVFIALKKLVKSESSHTIGVEFGSKVVSCGGKSIKLQIWDTAGQERFR